MGGISAGAGAAIAGGIGAAGSVAGSLISSGGQKQAAQTEQTAQNQMMALAQPYAKAGQSAEGNIINQLTSGQLGVAPPMTGAGLTQMPGYKFTLQQGLLSTQNAAAARGLGVSGAALMGAANYATGAASSNYQQYYNDYWANQQNRYNMLAGLMTTGENAAVGAGSNLVNSAANIGSSQAAAANATAAGTTGAATAAGNSLLMSALLNNQQGSTVSPTAVVNAPAGSGNIIQGGGGYLPAKA